MKKLKNLVAKKPSVKAQHVGMAKFLTGIGKKAQARANAKGAKIGRYAKGRK